MYHLTIKTSKICLSWTKDLHGKMNVFCFFLKTFYILYILPSLLSYSIQTSCHPHKDGHLTAGTGCQGTCGGIIVAFHSFFIWMQRRRIMGVNRHVKCHSHHNQRLCRLSRIFCTNVKGLV